MNSEKASPAASAPMKNTVAPHTDQILARALTWRYVVAFALLASLSTAAWFSLDLVISEQKNTAAIVNISGRQRMLSQRTALLANVLVRTPVEERAAVREQLQAAIELMTRSHHGLTHGDEAMGLPRTLSPAVRALYFEEPHSLDQQVDGYLKVITAFLLLDDEALNHATPLLQSLTSTSANILVKKLDQVVHQYQLEGEASVRHLQKIETSFWLLTLLLLLLEARLIFHPFTQHVRKLLQQLQSVTDDLQLHQENLEQLVAQRTATLEETTQSLIDSEEKFRLISTAAQDAIVILGQDELIHYWNPAAERLLGYTANEVIGQNLHELITPQRYRAEAHQGFQRFQEYGVGNLIGKTFDIEGLTKHGEEVPVSLSISAFMLNGHWHSVGILRDITERKEAEQKLRESERRLATLLDHNKIHMWAFDGTRYLYTNKQWFDYTGQNPADDLTLDRWLSAVHPADIESSKAIWLANWANKTEHDNHFRLRRHDGVYRDFFSHAVPIFDEQGHFQYFQGFNLDVTERKQMEEQVRQLAFYDALTGLPNRRLLNDRLIQALALSKRSQHYGALMFIDLDNFKPLNDQHGHGVGDLLLIEVAQRLTSGIREVDTVARFGGDEFVVMLNELETDPAEATAHAVQVAEKILETLAAPYTLPLTELADQPVITHHCTASIGVAMFINHAVSRETLLKQADIAMYRAKERGRNAICLYEDAPQAAAEQRN